MALKTMVQAINEALDIALEKDENIVLFGEDVGKNGGVFRVSDGLQAKYGEDRVFDTPLAESAIGGLAIGLTVEAFRPIMEIQFAGFLYEVMDALAGQMNRYRYRLSSVQSMPITVRVPFGGGVHTPEMHADSLEGLLTQTPGLIVVVPSNPIDAKGLLLAAIESNDPVIFFEHMKLYRSIKDKVPEGHYTVALGKANVVRDGKDISIITYGAMVHEAIAAAKDLEKEGISVEIIDLRTLSPLDIDTILASVKKTGRVIVAQEAQRQAGVSANVVAEISERAVLYLKAPIGRIHAPDTIYPFGMAEKEWLPNHNDIVNKVKEIMHFEY